MSYGGERVPLKVFNEIKGFEDIEGKEIVRNSTLLPWSMTLVRFLEFLHKIMASLLYFQILHRISLEE